MKEPYKQIPPPRNCARVILPARRIVVALFVWVLVIAMYPVAALPQSIEPSNGLTLIEAVKTTLSRQPGIRLEQETVHLAEGIFQEEKGVFDPFFSISGERSRTDLPLPSGSVDSHEITEATTLEFSLPKTLRNGMILKPSVSMTRTEDPLQYASTQNFSTVSFDIIAPLLRGRGEMATAGREMAARKNYDASLLQFKHTTARLVLETVTLYWNYVAAAIQLEESKKSESRTEDYVRMVEALVQRDERPGADLLQVVANFEAKASLRIASEQNFQEARQKLGVAMGLSFEEIDLLARPADPFPPVPDSSAMDHALASLVEQALAQRKDYLASKETAEAARILLEAERNSTLPFLDLDLSVGYSGLDEGGGTSRFVNSNWENIPGPSASVMLRYKWPVGNNSALGRIRQRSAASRQQTLESEDLGRKIGSSIGLAFSAVKSTAAETRRIRRSVLTYETVLANEQKKVRMGWSTFFDLMLMEDRLQDAIQSEVSARFRYADALARLCFERGLLLTGEGERAFVRMEDLLVLPRDSNEKDRP